MYLFLPTNLYIPPPYISSFLTEKFYFFPQTLLAKNEQIFQEKL